MIKITKFNNYLHTLHSLNISMRIYFILETSCHDDGCPPTHYNLKKVRKVRKSSLRPHSNR